MARLPASVILGGSVPLGKYLMVLLGGGLGSLARYVLGTAIMSRFGGKFPLGTLVINVTGSFVIGVLMTLFTERFQPHPHLRLILVIGFLGGYTTFSSFEYETLQAARDGGWPMALLNVAASLVLGFAAVWAGAMLAARR
ncbi:MAG: fluoride efflux transporter CrcB [Acidobacteriota bacterium]